MVLAELAGRVSHGFENVRNGDGLIGYADWSSGLSDRREASPKRQFTGDEVRPSGGAARFCVIVGEAHTLAGHPVQIRSSAGHKPLIVDTYVRPTDVIAHDDDDVWLFAAGCRWKGCRLLSLRHLDQRA